MLAEISFHNAHPEAGPGDSLLLPRYPEVIRQSLSENGALMAADSCGVEIRFVTDARNIDVTLSNAAGETRLEVFCGAFYHSSHRLPSATPATLSLEAPPFLQDFSDADFLSSGYDKNVWRIVLGRGQHYFHAVDTKGASLRAPGRPEVPRTRWLAYGSATTHAGLHGYPLHGARLLHWEVLNKALTDACLLEPQAIDYLAQITSHLNIDVVTAELGLDMLAACSVKEFQKRVELFVSTMREQHSEVPLILITSFPSCWHRKETRASDKQLKFDQVLREMIDPKKDPLLCLVEGGDLMTDFTLLGCDLLQPSPSGQAEIGYRLACCLGEMMNDRMGAEKAPQKASNLAPA
ncbi:MAG: lysophospholipase [Verrucomicrobiales bacterium]